MFWWFTFWLMTPIKRSKKLRGTTEFLFGDSLCYFTLQIKEEKQIQVSQQCQKYLESLCIRSSSNLYHAVEGVCILSQMKFWMALFIFGFRIYSERWIILDPCLCYQSIHSNIKMLHLFELIIGLSYGTTVITWDSTRKDIDWAKSLHIHAVYTNIT